MPVGRVDGRASARNLRGAPSAAMVALSMPLRAALFTHESPQAGAGAGLHDVHVHGLVPAERHAGVHHARPARERAACPPGFADRPAQPSRPVRRAGHRRPQRRPRTGGNMVLYLDGFAPSTTHGHAAGDTLLTQVSARLAALPADAVAARIGGDEPCAGWPLVRGRSARTGRTHHCLGFPALRSGPGQAGEHRRQRRHRLDSAPRRRQGLGRTRPTGPLYLAKSVGKSRTAMAQLTPAGRRIRTRRRRCGTESPWRHAPCPFHGGRRWPRPALPPPSAIPAHRLR